MASKNTDAANSTPMAMIAKPATLFSVGWLSNRKRPSVVAVSPSAMKMAEKVATKTRLRPTTLGSTRRPSSSGRVPDTVAR